VLDSEKCERDILTCPKIQRNKQASMRE